MKTTLGFLSKKKDNLDILRKIHMRIQKAAGFQVARKVLGYHQKRRSTSRLDAEFSASRTTQTKKL